HVQAENKCAAIIRTTVVYGVEPQGKNFVYQLLRRVRSGEPVHVPRDQISTPTYNLDLAAATVELIEREVVGVTHVAGPDALDRYAFALEVCAAFGLDPSLVKAVDTE